MRQCKCQRPGFLLTFKLRSKREYRSISGQQPYWLPARVHPFRVPGFRRSGSAMQPFRPWDDRAACARCRLVESEVGYAPKFCTLYCARCEVILMRSFESQRAAGRLRRAIKVGPPKTSNFLPRQSAGLLQAQFASGGLVSFSDVRLQIVGVICLLLAGSRLQGKANGRVWLQTAVC